ncbi:hypothetical protein M0D21_04745 [Aquimarina sp. D1M17]|uniref:hypothetical protein n=1 Tax=Aquimarina acroporae TaxID=2937283 RepID=UPI0020BE8B5E|nr:hypothetical protein [Aquimarina acroporae]MCK8520859.1 hypothetical protein [Aquimarina acroporae]
MKTEHIILKRANLTNNCPECYATDGMVLSFMQEKKTSSFIIKTNKKVLDNIHCSKCGTQIFPGRWTPDIERVYDYHRKTITAKPGSTKFTGLSYAIVFILITILSLGYIYFSHPELLGLTS